MREMTEYEAEKEYVQYLDEVYGPVKVAGLMYETSEILQRLDEPAFREGFNNWLDAEDIELED